MSGLRQALDRLEGRSSRPALHVEPMPSVAHAEFATIDAPATREPRDLATALSTACPPPALIALVGIGVEDPWTAPLREAAEAVARRIGRDVVLLGPGLLDDGPTLTAQWSTLRERAAYGFLHAPAEYAAGRLDGLGRVDAVVPVIELGRTSPRAVEAFRRLLAARGIGLLGAVVLDE